MAFMKSVGAVRNEAIRIFLPCLVGVVSGWVVAYAVIYSAAALFSVEALVPLERWERPFVALLGVIGALLALHVTGNGLHTPLRILADHLRHKKFHKFMTEQEIRDYTPEDMAIMEDACNATGPEPSPEMVERLRLVLARRIERRKRFEVAVLVMSDSELFDWVSEEWQSRGGDQIDWIVYSRWERAWFRLVDWVRKAVGK